jgi:hypothetical protein
VSQIGSKNGLIHRNFKEIIGKHSFVPKGSIGIFLLELNPSKLLCCFFIPKGAKNKFPPLFQRTRL